MWLKEKFNFFFHSFQVRIFLALTLIIVIVIPGTGYFCYLQARKVAEQQMQQSALGTAVMISKRVESFLSQYTYNAKLIKSFFENQLIDYSDDKQILKYFYLFQQDHPEFVNINFGDETGRFLMAPAQIPEVHKIFDPRVRPWYRGAIRAKGVYWTDVYLFASTQKPGMAVSVPIYDNNGSVKAVCGIDIDISAFSKFLKGIKIGKQGFAYIFENKQGRVIAHPSLVQLPWNPYHIDLLRTCLTDLKRENKTFGMSSFQGDQFFTAYTDYSGNDWTVGVTLPVSDFLENIITIKRAIITLVIAGILLSSLLSYLLAMTIVSPLNILKKGIERISSGDLEYKVNITNPDIASALAGSFNQMASSLRLSINELKKTYAELAQNEKLAAVGQMTASIAHEIKNPLGIILGSAQVVSNPDRPLEMREKAAVFIMEEVGRLNKTLTAFLNFAKPAPPNFQRIDIVDLLEEIFVSTEEHFSEKGYRLDRAFPDMAPIILADPDQIKEVFWNILLNAIQSMPDGGTINVRIDIEKGKGTIDESIIPIMGLTQQNPDYLTVSISDQGCGISDEQMEKILDPFVSFRDDGIGLGLSIVSQIVKYHKGLIKINSTLGEGTQFKLLFPSVLQEK
ncbi:MAG: Cache 3/Cache 2 fusion domain-containing protein [Desulfobacterales bacterium]|nr:Cache 3/Cache 2 fusion domain-containing protein [Desulfobacterales bacterium]